MVLGELEQQVMAILWRHRVPLAVRDVQDALRQADRDLAYTTTMTVLDRLAKKGVVGREMEGRAWLYRPLKTCVELHVDEIVGMLTDCGEGHARLVMRLASARIRSVTIADQNSCLRSGDPERIPFPPEFSSLEEWCGGRCVVGESADGDGAGGLAEVDRADP